MHTAPAERTARFGAGLARDEKVLVKTCLMEVMRARCPDARCTQSREADGTVVLARLARLTCCIARTGLDRFRAKLLVIGANRVVPDALAHDRVEQATGSLNECARPRWGRWGRVGCNRGRSNSGCDCTTDSDSMADVYHTDGARARESASSFDRDFYRYVSWSNPALTRHCSTDSLARSRQAAPRVAAASTPTCTSRRSSASNGAGADRGPRVRGAAAEYFSSAVEHGTEYSTVLRQDYNCPRSMSKVPKNPIVEYTVSSVLRPEIKIVPTKVDRG